MKWIKNLLTATIFTCFLTNLQAQERLHRNDTIVVIENGSALKLPWSGGLNGGTFSEIDVNFDGVKDLFIFEANNRYDPMSGDRISIYLKLKDSIGNFYFKYAPEYKSSFPKMDYFCLLRDFNGDGKEDIFTRNEIDQIQVFRNDSDPKDSTIKFTLFIKKIQSSAPPSLAIPPYPFFKDIFQDYINASSFEDIDGDGDIDMLILDRSENYIEYHKNISTSRDTMIFELRNTIWGDAVVNKDTIVLNQSHPLGNIANPERTKFPKNYYNSGGSGKGNKDAGVGLLAIDLNGDGVKDLISATPYSLRAAINNGTVTSSHINKAIFDYPPSKPVKNVSLFAAPSYVDLDFDNIKDLIVSVMWDEFEDDSSSSLYKNTGSTSNPVFAFQADNYLQKEMIDVGTRSYPKFFDYNGDSLMDIIIGGEGQFVSYNYPNPTTYKPGLVIYKNIGQKWAPKFELLTKDYLSLSNNKLDTANNKAATALNPAFGDIDGDGDDDMLLGDKNGYVHYFENTAGAGNIMTFAAPIINYQGIQVGLNAFFPGNGYAAPQIIDLNRDGLLDLIIGERSGNISYYKNTGSTTNPVFTLENDSLGEVSVSASWDFVDGGANKPYIFSDKNTGDYKLICGSKTGFLLYYDEIEANGALKDTFTVSDSSYQDIWTGPFSSIHGADINGDTTVDFLIGNQSGGVVLYTSTGIGYPIGIDDSKTQLLKSEIYPNPTKTGFNISVEGLNATTPVVVTISDILGREQLKKTLLNNSYLDIHSISKGIFFVNLSMQNGKNIATHKLIVR